MAGADPELLPEHAVSIRIEKDLERGFDYRRITIKETENAEDVESLLSEANTEALKELADAMYQENIEIEGLLPRDEKPIVSLESRFNVVVHRGETVYKSLPCGELQYDASGLKKVQIGFRTTGITFIL